MSLLYYDPLFLEHHTGDHPECAARILPAARRLNQLTVHFGCPRASWSPISLEDLQLVHTPEYIEFLRRTCEDGGGQLDPDTVVSPRSFEVACLAAGAVADAVAKVIRGPEHQAFCLVRPPGHHALPDRAMGFCLFANVAIGAKLAIEKHGLTRVLIIDWDVHHGNGTQDIFWEERRIALLSVHRDHFYPGSGAATETGGGAAVGTKLNLPISTGTPRGEILERFTAGLSQLAERMQPELILISAGFDAHRLDPYGSLGLETEDFEVMTRRVVEIARKYCGGKIVSVLEGGYHPETVADCVDAHIHELMRAG